MKDLLDKLSSYNLFNHLFPGIVFTIVLSNFTSYNFIQENIIVGLFFYYFIGLVISRIGSLVIEPFLKLINFIKFTTYANFVQASKLDDKINMLSEVNNMYRTISSLFFTLIWMKLFEVLESTYIWVHEYRFVILIIVLLTIFICSYKKQTSYITKRIEANLK